MPSFQDIYDSAPPPLEEVSFEFPPPTKDHILHCSYDWWFPRFKSHCIKSTIIPIPQDVLNYLNEDGIIQADKSDAGEEDNEDDIEWATPSTNDPSLSSSLLLSSIARDSDDNSDSSEEEDQINTTPPNKRFPRFHQGLKSAIEELDGAVIPKLNWSAPKDAAFMRGENSLRCISPNDVYVLLKSSSFAAHDLGHAFDGCSDRQISPEARPQTENKTNLPYSPVLVLRTWFSVQTSLEFRCFVKHNTLIGLTQRDRNQYNWLPDLREAIVGKVDDFFEKVLRGQFPDHSYAFDVYIPEDRGAADKLGRVRLMDINPWAPRTDSLLFGWSELLTMKVPGMMLGMAEPVSEEESEPMTESEDEEFLPGLRLVEHGCHVNLMSTEYSAHKLPREVVDAAQTEGGMSEFMGTWRRMVETRCQMDDQR